MKTTTILRNVRRDPDLRRGVNFLVAAAVFAVICFAAAGIGAAAIRAAIDHDMGLDQSIGKLPPYNLKAGATPASQKAPVAPGAPLAGQVPKMTIELSPDVRYAIQEEVRRQMIEHRKIMTRPILPMVAPDPKVKVKR